ncbi:enamine deaminase RidA (YjgF/YER057c/UK114 family) [Leucobacter komagatae]|uniref:Enamine deaminase RidA (YjgF/YER057c/UK114 family) n=1 Tax=Leucobacter komagatae TaxID=55969 RepID=A0A542Y9N1_9MICO|nr:RidA family protein [Leucobacter komagatae]TQL44800.1 enamine deaminase RidA (YjgF/YER057c/UK114 family) [Leucobacter komagatae]
MNSTRDALALSLGATDGPSSPTMAQCVNANGLIFTSGHTSLTLGKVGADLSVEQGAQAAREAALRLLHSVREHYGTLDGLVLAQLNVCVNTTPDFTQHGAVAEGASSLLREVFGGSDLPTRKALGMASLPRGVAVEIDAVFAATDA